MSVSLHLGRHRRRASDVRRSAYVLSPRL